MEKLNKNELVEIVAEKGHLSKRDARVAMDLVFDLMEEALLEGKEVNITNFGTFVPNVRKQREGTDPKTHKIITIKERRSISFKMSKALKAKIVK